MIISQRAASIDFGTDHTARSLRTFLAASGRLASAASAPAAPAPVDYERLYPALFAVPDARVRPVFALRAAAAAVAGIAAAFVAVLHG